MDSTHEAKPLETQNTGVPVDHRDPNHPHFPGDLEAQPAKQPLVNKKAWWITAGVGSVILSLVISILVGGKIGMDMAKKPVIPPVYVTVSAEVDIVYTTTTTVSTPVTQFSITPDPTTITTTTMIPFPSLVSLAPTTTPSPAPIPTPVPEPPKDAPPPAGANKVCFTVGSWKTKEECDRRCTGPELHLKPDRIARCDVDKKGVHSCEVCMQSIPG